MDDKDQLLISLLRKNARTPTVTLAKALGVSRATVSNRLTKLENSGVIQGYSVRLRSEADSGQVKILMNLRSG